MKKVLEVVSIERTNGESVFLGLSVARPSTEDTTTEEAGALFNMMFGAIPEKQKTAMTESLKRAVDMQKERDKRERPAAVINQDMVVEVSDKEYEEMGRPQLGEACSVEISKLSKDGSRR